MNTERKLGLQVKIISIVGDAEYEGKTYGYYVRVENRDGVQWDLLDSRMQTSPDLVGKKCHVEMLAFLSEIELQQGSEKGIRYGSHYLPILYGQVVQIEITRSVTTSEKQPYCVDVDLSLDVGEGLIRCDTTYWFERES